MTTATTNLFNNVTLNPQANVYFDGKCISHSFTLADGTKKSAGVVLPSHLTFNTGAAEVMECVAGSCEYKLKGSESWVVSNAGERFDVPANSSFEIRVAQAYHYICHFA
jgi:purine/pyrimidine-nucleoside phosphorylase